MRGESFRLHYGSDAILSSPPRDPASQDNLVLVIPATVSATCTAGDHMHA